MNCPTISPIYIMIGPVVPHPNNKSIDLNKEYRLDRLMAKTDLWSTRSLCREIVLELINMMVSPGRLFMAILIETMENLEEFRRKVLVSNILEEVVVPEVMVRVEADSVVNTMMEL